MTAALLELRVKPNAKQSQLIGWHGTALKLAVQATPERGRANAAVVALLAEVLQLPAAALTIVAGETSPNKRLRVVGITAEALRQRIDAALAGD